MRTGKLRHRVSGDIIEVTATTKHPDCSYGLPVWVDKNNVAYLQCDSLVDSPLYEVIYDSNWGRSKVGRMLADLRTKRGLTQRQLAERTGLSYSNIGKLETGKYNVSVDILYHMLNALDAELVIKEKAAE